MKKIASSVAIIVSLLAVGSAQAGQNCAVKRAALERQISIAQQYGNISKVNALRHALAKVNTYCTDSSVGVDAQKNVKKLEKKIADQQEDIRELKEDLRKAQAKGDRKKVEKYKRKLAEEQAELRELKQKLKQALAEAAK